MKKKNSIEVNFNPEGDNIFYNYYNEYRVLMIHEAEGILSNKPSYVLHTPIPIQDKISRISDLLDFFVVENEQDIVDDLIMIRNSIKIQMFINLQINELI
jgi:hypothetical protein